MVVISNRAFSVKRLLIGLVMPAYAALRSSKMACSPFLDRLNLFAPVDPLNCSSKPILHDKRSDDHPVLKEYKEHINTWFETEFLPRRSSGTLKTDPEEMYITLPNGGNFVFWEQRERDVNSWWTNPVFDLSAWYTDDSDKFISIEGSYFADPYTWNFIFPDPQHTEMNDETVKLEGDYAIFISGWYGAYQHLLIDHLGYLVYMSKTLPQKTRILLPRIGSNDQTFYEIINNVDPELAKRVDFMSCSTILACHRQVFEVQNGSLKILVPKSSTRHLELLQMVRSWLWNSPFLLENIVESDNEKTVIYYTRNSADHKTWAVNARFMDQKEENLIPRKIEHALMRYGRKERLVIYDGHMTFEEQVKLFASATTVIGAHGGGLANILFMAPPANRSDSKCEKRPKVLEFITGPETPDVQHGDTFATYFLLYSTCPWVELHQVLFTPPSNSQHTFIDMHAFDSALKALFSDKYEEDS